ncbi:MAG: NnrS family protein, partial [Moraxellaceae bacterium]
MSLLAFPFRIFFLLTGIFGVVTVSAWMSYLFGGLPLPLGWSPAHWHSHEMLFGLAGSAIAGFLLTAMCNWTGAAPLRNVGLFSLACLWLSGRFVMWTASWWPSWIVAVLDLAFLLTVAVYALRILLIHGNKRNLIMVAILLLLGGANGMMHIGFATSDVAWLIRGEVAAFNLLTLLMVVIGGRIIPMFTINWLRNHGHDISVVRQSSRLDIIAIVFVALLIPADLLSPTQSFYSYWINGVIALTAGGILGTRLLGWAGWKTAREPLLWVLNLGYLWIVIALFLKSAAAFGIVAPSAWQHAIGVGGMGTLILGIMARVALAHTG